MKNVLNEIGKRFAVRGDDKGRWITTENGHHVHISGEGTPDKGSPYVLAKMKGEETGEKAKAAPKAVAKQAKIKAFNDVADWAVSKIEHFTHDVNMANHLLSQSGIEDKDLQRLWDGKGIRKGKEKEVVGNVLSVLSDYMGYGDLINTAKKAGLNEKNLTDMGFDLGEEV